MGNRAFKYDKVLCKKFGRRLAALRKSKNMTQEELSFHVNISPSYLSSIERGITDTTISTVKRLAKALNIKFTDLFDF